MTSFSSQRIDCGVCGHSQILSVLASTNRSGSPDLDLRPPSMERETLHAQVQSCTACGYCAPSIGQRPHASAGATMKRAAYRAMLLGNGLPSTASHMACWGMLEEAADQPLRAGWAALKAAWACDDASKQGAAKQFRELAADRFDRAISARQMPFEERGMSHALLADLWRRAGRFDMAVSLASAGLVLKAMGGVNRTVEDMLRYQVQLAWQKDTACHTVGQAERAAPDWPEREAAAAAERQRCDEAQRAARALERERLSPRALVRSLASLTTMFTGPEETGAMDAGSRAEKIRPWLERLPLPPSMAAIMEANVRAYGWPVVPTLGAFGLATLGRLDADEQASFGVSERMWNEMCEGHAPLLDYLHWCLRDATALTWHYSPPQREGIGAKPPAYPAVGATK